MSISRVQMFRITIAVALVALLLAAAAFVPMGTALAYDSYYKDEIGFDDSVFNQLDYGIYWYDNDSVIPKKAGTAGANFDPSKPTIIFTHGMKENEGYNRRDLVSLWGATNGQFESKGYEAYMYEEQYYQVLLGKGYNVGHFYWNQLAEIGISGDIRIWTSDLVDDYDHPVDLGYTVCDESGNPKAGDPAHNPTDSVAVLYGEAIKAALGSDYDQPLRLVGHSMGGQLVLATTQNLVHQQKTGKIGANLVPERVSLIDPYLCNTTAVEGMRVDHLDYQAIPEGTWTAELAANALEEIADFGVAVDAYGGTQFVYHNFKLMAMMGLNDEDPRYEAAYERCHTLLGRLGTSACWTHLEALASAYGAMSHCMIIDYYFTTMYEDVQTDNYGVELPSCTSSTEYIRQLRGVNFAQRERDGSTANPFYRHTTDFVRVDAWQEEVERKDAGIIYGVKEGYTTAELTDADGKVLQTATLTSVGEYHFFNVKDGNYIIKYSAADAEIATTKVTVDAAKSPIAVIAESNVLDLVILCVTAGVVVLLLVGMIVAIAAAASATKKAKQA